MKITDAKMTINISKNGKVAQRYERDQVSKLIKYSDENTARLQKQINRLAVLAGLNTLLIIIIGGIALAFFY